MTNNLEKENYLIEMFNKMLEIKGLTYSDFNKVIPFNNEEFEKLEKLEKEYPELGIYIGEDLGNNLKGVSMLSLIATITDVFFNKRFGLNIDGDDNIQDKSERLNSSKVTGFVFLEYNKNSTSPDPGKIDGPIELKDGRKLLIKNA